MKFLITGANGFVGQALCAEAMRRGLRVRGATRSACELTAGAESAVVGAIDGETNWTEALAGVDIVIHLAARVHVMHDTATDPLAEFRRVNTAGTEHLARGAAASGVKRLVYVSSIKVNGEETLPPLPSPDGTTSHSTMLPKDSSQVAGYPPQGGREFFREEDIPNPQDPYAISKWQAEQALHRVAGETGLEVVIVRPPLVYGPGVKGNFVQMLDVVGRRAPLPFASVHNRRSLVYVGNLVDALITCAAHPAAAGQTYLVCDGEDVSTPDLLRQIAVAMGVPSRLFPCPPALLRLAGKLAGKSQQLERLLGSLQVDGDKIRRDLNWAPPYSLQQGLQATAEWYRTKHT